MTIEFCSSRTALLRQRRHRRRAILLGADAGACSGGLAVVLALNAHRTWLAAGAAPGPSPNDAVQLCALGLGTVAASWLTILLLLTTASMLPGVLGGWGRAGSALVAPLLTLRLMGLLLGGSALAWTAAGPAAVASPTVVHSAVDSRPVPVGAINHAVTVDRAGGVDALPRPTFGATPSQSPPSQSPPSQSPPSQPPPSQCLPAPGWRPTTAPVRRTSDADVGLVGGCPPRDTSARVVVLRGDTLWSVAERHLGPGATPAEIATSWPRWFAANRATIGDDPDLLLPGQVLVAPKEAA